MSTPENTGKQLGQLRPADTTAASLYSPAAEIIAELTVLTVCATTGGATKYRVFHDEDGTTYDETTALYFDEAINANTTDKIDMTGVWMRNSSGNIAVRTNTNDAITFTLYGFEHHLGSGQSVN